MKPLFASEILLGRLNRNVPEKELNLFEFTASRMAEAGTSAAEIVRGWFLDCGTLGTILDDMPNDLLRHADDPAGTGWGREIFLCVARNTAS